MRAPSTILPLWGGCANAKQTPHSDGPPICRHLSVGSRGLQKVSISEARTRTAMGFENVWRCARCNPKGVRNVPTRVRVRLSRKRNEDEEAKDKMFTLVPCVIQASPKGLNLIWSLAT
jgi:hypothetical protein